MATSLLPALTNLIFQIGAHKAGGMNKCGAVLFCKEIKSPYNKFRLHGAWPRLACLPRQQHIAADNAGLQMLELFKPLLNSRFGPDIQVDAG